MKFTIYGVIAKQGMAVTWEDGVVDHPGLHQALQNALDHQHRRLEAFGDGNVTACLPPGEHDAWFAYQFISYLFTRIVMVEGCNGFVSHIR